MWQLPHDKSQACQANLDLTLHAGRLETQKHDEFVCVCGFSEIIASGMLLQNLKIVQEFLQHLQ